MIPGDFFVVSVGNTFDNPRNFQSSNPIFPSPLLSLFVVKHQLAVLNSKEHFAAFFQLSEQDFVR